MYPSKCFNSNYMDFLGYETCDKLICTSGKGCRSTKTIIKQGIPNININMTYPSAKLGSGCSPHKDTFDVLSEILVSQIFQEYSSINEGRVLRYMNKVKSRHSNVLQTKYGYQNCCEKQVLMLDMYLLNNILHYQLITAHCIIFCLGLLWFHLIAYFVSRCDIYNKQWLW